MLHYHDLTAIGEKFNRVVPDEIIKVVGYKLILYLLCLMQQQVTLHPHDEYMGTGGKRLVKGEDESRLVAGSKVWRNRRCDVTS